MTRTVLDASIVSRARLPAQLLSAAITVVLENADTRFAPLILRQKFYHTVLKAERRQGASQAAADALVARFERLEITHLWDDDWVPRAWRLARERSLGLFDTIYLVCAEDLDAELWTCDRQFVTRLGAARPARVKLCPDDL